MSQDISLVDRVNLKLRAGPSWNHTYIKLCILNVQNLPCFEASFLIAAFIKERMVVNVVDVDQLTCVKNA